MTVVKGTRLEFADASANPSTAGYLQRNGADLKWHNGSTVITLGEGTVTAGSTNTFTNKTIDLGGNTVTGSVAEFNTALQSDSFATLASANTFTGATTSFAGATSFSVTSPNIYLGDASSDVINVLGTLTFTEADIDLVDNTASALSFDASGKTGILEIVTTNGSEKVKMSGDLEVTGGLTVNGTTTTINSTTLTVDDKNIEIASVASPDDTTADGAGITIKGATDKTILWDNANDNLTSNQDWNIVSSKSYKINNAVVLNATTLGTAVVGSSLTSVGTLTGLTVAGAITLNATNELRLADTDSSHYVGFKSPATVTTNKVWTLPSVDGANGQALVTNASGVLSWASAGGAYDHQATTYSVISAPSDPATDKVTIYAKDIDVNNEGLFMKCKKNGSVVEVQVA